MKARPTSDRPDPLTRFLRAARCLVALLACCTAGPAGAAVRYVQSGQTNQPPDGLAWATAYPNVQQALTTAAAGDQIWVASGIYLENLLLPDGIELYGGFSGTEFAIPQRDWLRYPTILDGQRSNSVVGI